MPKRVRRDVFFNTGFQFGVADCLPDDFRGDGFIGPPAFLGAREQVGLGDASSASSRARFRRSSLLNGTSRSTPPLPCSTRSIMRLLSMLATFIWHSSLRRSPAAYSVITIARWDRFLAESISRPTSSWLSTTRQFLLPLGIRQIFLHVAALQHLYVKKPQRRDAQNDRRVGELSLFQQMDVISAQVVRAEFFQRFVGPSAGMR